MFFSISISFFLFLHVLFLFYNIMTRISNETIQTGYYGQQKLFRRRVSVALVSTAPSVVSEPGVVLELTLES